MFPVGNFYLSNHRVTLRLNILDLCLDFRRRSVNVLLDILHIIFELAARVLDLESPDALSEDIVHSGA